MENKNFDHIIKSKLEELEGLSPIADWNLFHSKFRDELEDQTATFDKVIQEKFDQLEVPYNGKHWYIMKEALEREEFIRTSIYFSKIVEAGCIFLILFTFLNLFPTFTTHYNPDKIETEDSSDLIAHNGKDFDGKLIEKSNNAIDSAIKQNEENRNNFIVGTSQSNIANNQITKTQKIKIIDNYSSLSKTNASSTLPVKNIQSDELIANADNANLPNIYNPNNHPNEKESQFDSPQNPTFSAQNRNWVDNLANIEQIAIVPLEIRRSFYIPFFNLYGKKKPVTEKYISFSFAPTVNIVNSPFDYINKTKPYSTDALGGEIGFNYSISRNNLEIETGLNYGRKSYEPKQIDEVTGSFITSFSRLRLRQITYDVMSIPMNIKYHFKKGNGWGMYALMGTSINGISNSDYLVEANGSKISIYDVQTNYRESNTAKKHYNPGILEGGNILDNLYFTLDLAIGVEKNISTNTSFFVAPTLRQHLGLAGVGPNNDKVNSLGINLGIKKKL